MENKEISSANNLISEFKLLGKSLIKMRKGNGPKIEHYGNPARIGSQSES